jgi:hypothetical protein
MPKAARAQTEVDRRLAAAEASIGRSVGTGRPDVAEPLLRLAEALEAARELIIQPDRKQDRAERAHLAAMQYESFQRVQTDLTALMLRGHLDPAAHREACNSIEQVTKRLFLLAERMDRQTWAERPKDQVDDGQGIVAALEAASSRFRKITLEFHGPRETQGAVIEGESVRVPAVDQEVAP